MKTRGPDEASYDKAVELDLRRGTMVPLATARGSVTLRLLRRLVKSSFKSTFFATYPAPPAMHASEPIRDRRGS